MRALRLLALLPPLFFAACVSGGGVGRRAGSSTDAISEEDLSGLSGISAYEAVERLRGTWLRGRAGAFPSDSGRTYPMVFVDGRPWGELDALHQIDVNIVATIRFISAVDATTRFGTGYPGGIIEVITKG